MAKKKHQNKLATSQHLVSAANKIAYYTTELNIPGPVLSCQALLATTTMHSSLSQQSGNNTTLWLGLKQYNFSGFNAHVAT